MKSMRRDKITGLLDKYEGTEWKAVEHAKNKTSYKLI